MKKCALIFLSFVFLLAHFAEATHQPLLKNHSRLSLTRLFPKVSARPGLAKSCSNLATLPRMIQDSSVVYDFSKKVYAPGEVITVSYSASGHLVSLVQMVADDSIAQNIYGASWKTTYYSNTGGDIDSLVDQAYGDSGWTNYDKMQIVPPLSDAYLAIDRPQGAGFGLFCTGGSLYFHVSSLDGQNWYAAGKTWYNTGRDTVAVIAPGIVVRTDQSWVLQSSSYVTDYCDSFFTEGGKNIVKAIETNYNDSMKYICIGVYDSAGNELEESQTSMAWDNGTGSWSYDSKLRYTQTYDTNGALLTSVVQDSSNGHWTPADSCNKIIYRYTYDNGGAIVSRVDSTWYSDDNISKEIHYFKYQASPIKTVPGHSFAAARFTGAHISQNGMVRTDSPVFVSVFDLSGRSICTVPVEGSNLSLWDWCKSHGISVGKGVYAARIRETGRSYPVWRE